jgi:NADPH2:quinone reductase
MRAVQVDRFGGPDVMRLVDLPLPEPGSDEALIEVRAAGVNRIDVLLRSGRHHTPPTLPFVPGREASGIVKKVGPDVGAIRPDTAVVALVGRPGAYAEFMAVPAGKVVPMPEGLDWASAASLPTAWLTAWYCLRHLARLKEGEILLVHAAASGVGDAAVQIAKHLGARVIATAGSDEKVAWALANGADWGLNYERQDLLAETSRLTDGRGVQVVLDAVGGRMFPLSLKAIGSRGRVVALANVALEDSVINTRDFYPKNATVYGFQMSRLLEEGYDPRQDLEALMELHASGILRVNVDRVFPLAAAPEAHAYLEERRNRGKVVLAPGDRSEH